MGREQQLALARRLEEDPGFAEGLRAATSVEDAVSLVRRYGLDIEPADLATGELTDAELDGASGGTGSIFICVSIGGDVCW